MFLIRSIVAFVVIAFTALTPLAADETTPRLVTLNVVATDAQGKAVTDLTAAEVQITDQGKSAPIVAFRNDALHLPAGAREFSNRPGPALSHIQVVLFDVLNLSMSNRKPAMDQIVRALEGLETSDSVYLYLLNIQGDLTPVRALPDELPDGRPLATPWTRVVRPLLEQAVGPVAAVQSAMARDVVLRVQRTYAAMEALAARMAVLPGRKNILWITFGVPCNLTTENGQIWDCRPNLNKVAAKLDQANVAVNPVALQAAAADPESTLTMQQFVELTGGKLYPGGDIERVVPDAIEQGRAGYRVQYAPANNWDGKPHKIRATTSRKGVNLQTRQSYIAEKIPAVVNENDRNMALFQSPFDATDIGLTVAVTPGAQPHTVHLRIGMETQDLLLTQRAERYAGQLASYVVGYLPDNRLQEYPALPINLNLTAEQREKMSRDGIHLGQDVTIAPGVHKIRLLMVDRTANTAGTITIPVE